MSPNGNPNHNYGNHFHPNYLRVIHTQNGDLTVCKDCEYDCYVGMLKDVHGLRPVQFLFGMDQYEEPVNGFTNDTYWNGFLNVQVTQEVHKSLDELYGEDMKFPIGENGLIDYGGGAVVTHEYKIEEDTH